MKTVKILFVSLLFAVFSGCNGQTQNENAQQSDKNKEKVVIADSLNKPRIDVKVNKQYDSKGNLIKFDSTYSYFYSSPTGPLRSTNDSVFSSFRSFFEKSYPNLMDRNSDNIFFNDDYFQKRFELNQRMFGNMYQQMDSIKRDYLRQKYPNGQQKKINYRK